MKPRVKPPNSDKLLTRTNADVELFWAMISMKRPYESQAEIIFNRDFLDKRVPFMKVDAFGNRYCVVGPKDPEIMFACHTDTVHRDGGIQRVLYDSTKRHAFVDVKDTSTNCLGADDTTGVWLCLEMIRAGVPGMYVFHRGEEAGCVGSKYIAEETPELVANIKMCLSLDRKDTNEVITHQGGHRCASDRLGEALAAQLNNRYRHFKYKTSDRGAWTDSERYCEIIPECLNMGVGYYGQHSSSEYQDVEHMIHLRKALINVDWRTVLDNVERVPEPKRFSRFGHTTLMRGGYAEWFDDDYLGQYGYDEYGHLSTTPKQGAEDTGEMMNYFEMYQYVVENPDVITDVLLDHGVTESDLWDYEEAANRALTGV